MHFCVRLPGAPAGYLLVNVNVTERRLPTGVERRPRLIVLAHDSEWTGGLQTFEVEDSWGPPGNVAFRLGPTRVQWRDGAFELTLRTTALCADLRLVPCMPPTVPTSVSFHPGSAIHWVVVPRLEATGWVTREGNRPQRLDRAPAYHDHNWGVFRWGEDLAWEWGFVNPSDPVCPWTVAFVRISDGSRHRTLSQGALLWHEDALVRTFQDREIRVRLDGTHGGSRPLTVPKIASLLLPGASAGVPARATVEANGRDDWLRVDFETAAKARIALPSDANPFKLVSLNEACGRARVSGRQGARRFDFEGTSLMEFVRG